MSNEIDELIKNRAKPIKKEKNQLPIALILLLLVAVSCILLLKHHYAYAVCLGVGTIIGIILRFSRFCFTAAFRDPFITGNTVVFRGVLLAMIVSTVGFAVIQSLYIKDKGIDYQTIPGAVSSVGLHTVIGAFIFGIGMVLAGGCASGVLMRIGEGHAVHLVVLVGFMIGTVLGARDYSFWYELFIKDAKTIYFSEYLDLRIVAVIQIVVLLLLYWLSFMYEKKHTKG